MKNNILESIIKGYMFGNVEKDKPKAPKGDPNNKSLHLQDIPDSDTYGGVLADNIVQVDFDTHPSADFMYELLKKLDYKCVVSHTEHGKHFLFKTDGKISKQVVDRINGLAVPCDIGLGSKNRYEPISVLGQVRELELMNCESATDIDVMPCFLRPLHSKTTIVVEGVKNYTMHYTTLQTTTSRNNTVFAFISTLAYSHYNIDEIRETVTIINNNLLKEPFDDDELETIMRDEAIPKIEGFIY